MNYLRNGIPGGGCYLPKKLLWYSPAGLLSASLHWWYSSPAGGSHSDSRWLPPALFWPVAVAPLGPLPALAHTCWEKEGLSKSLWTPKLRCSSRGRNHSEKSYALHDTITSSWDQVTILISGAQWAINVIEQRAIQSEGDAHTIGSYPVIPAFNYSVTPPLHHLTPTQGRE